MNKVFSRFLSKCNYHTIENPTGYTQIVLRQKGKNESKTKSILTVKVKIRTCPSGHEIAAYAPVNLHTSFTEASAKQNSVSLIWLINTHFR